MSIKYRKIKNQDHYRSKGLLKYKYFKYSACFCCAYCNQDTKECRKAPIKFPIFGPCGTGTPKLFKIYDLYDIIKDLFTEYNLSLHPHTPLFFLDKNPLPYIISYHNNIISSLLQLITKSITELNLIQQQYIFTYIKNLARKKKND